VTTRRNAFDNDILDDLGINTADLTPQVPTPAHREDATPTTPEPAVRSKRIGVDVTEELWIATKVIAAQQGTTVADIIRTHLQSIANPG
jgi:hypothetical protein